MADHKNILKFRGPGLLARIRTLFGFNFGTAIFGVLFLYMLFSGIVYITSSHIESYEVTAGPLSRNETYTGLAIREEKVVQAASNGYVTYYAREGSKINANGAVYGISTTPVAETTAELSSEDLSTIRSEMLSFSKGFDSSSFNKTYSFKTALEGDILQYAGLTENRVTDENGIVTEISYTASSGNQNICMSDTDGIVLYSKDGYENVTVNNFTSDDFSQTSYHLTDLKSDKPLSIGDDVYRIVTDERWSLLIPLSEKQAANLAGRATVRVKFAKDGLTQSGDFTIKTIDGKSYGQIDFSKGLIRYASDRFLDIELVTNTVVGLKIPLSSMVTKEFYVIPSQYATQVSNSTEISFMVIKKGSQDTTIVTPNIYASEEQTSATGLEDDSETTYLYYVNKSEFDKDDIIINEETQKKYAIGDVGILEGVYCINKGYAVFRRIELLQKNDEYAIVSKNTNYGLTQYDHIVKNARNVKEEDILY